ncbi:MAG: hypothetical protein EBV03_09685 [Proteobacteria bacterium]|nr:hypothetical protein [Pseudomonadota bacterium]
MKNLVWLFGVLLALSFFLPAAAVKPPVSPVPVEPAAPVAVDAKVGEVLAAATDDDRANIVGIYTGLKTVLLRDNGQLVNNTEKFSVLQANTLKLAVEQVGKYPGLDLAIEAVFEKAVGTKDVTTVTPELVGKLAAACDLIINSAQSK